MVALTVREVLRKLRSEREWTQAELAIRAGVEVTTIHRVENTKKMPTYQPDLESIEKLAKAFGYLTLSQFFTQIEGLKAQPTGSTVNAVPNPQVEADDVTPVSGVGGVPYGGFAQAAALASAAELLAESIALAVDRIVETRQQAPTARHDASVRASGGRKVRR